MKLNLFQATLRTPSMTLLKESLSLLSRSHIKCAGGDPPHATKRKTKPQLSEKTFSTLYTARELALASLNIRWGGHRCLLPRRPLVPTQGNHRRLLPPRFHFQFATSFIHSIDNSASWRTKSATCSHLLSYRVPGRPQCCYRKLWALLLDSAAVASRLKEHPCMMLFVQVHVGPSVPATLLNLLRCAMKFKIGFQIRWSRPLLSSIGNVTSNICCRSTSPSQMLLSRFLLIFRLLSWSPSSTVVARRHSALWSLQFLVHSFVEPCLFGPCHRFSVSSARPCAVEGGCKRDGAHVSGSW